MHLLMCVLALPTVMNDFSTFCFTVFKPLTLRCDWLPLSGIPRRREGVHRHAGPDGEHGERLLADGVAGGGAGHRDDHQTEGEERGERTRVSIKLYNFK